MSCCHFLTFCEPTFTVIRKLCLYKRLHSFSRYLLSTYYVLGTVLGAKDAAVKKEEFIGFELI